MTRSLEDAGMLELRYVVFEDSYSEWKLHIHHGYDFSWGLYRHTPPAMADATVELIASGGPFETIEEAIIHFTQQAGQDVGIDDGPLNSLSKAANDVLDERFRQTKLGFTTEHDDRHETGAMGDAAAAYAAGSADLFRRHGGTQRVEFRRVWPEHWGGFDVVRRKGRRRQLVIAAALLIAEIERIDRLTEG